MDAYTLHPTAHAANRDLLGVHPLGALRCLCAVLSLLIGVRMDGGWHSLPKVPVLASSRETIGRPPAVRLLRSILKEPSFGSMAAWAVKTAR